eukprot:GHRR01002312.1.p1 GENE.GHRR01002312.1~~GHRR01002312.1.p1  ORF type:complete len:190 (+),score=15.91 GHRR01002312.1:28-570(+)
MSTYFSKAEADGIRFRSRGQVPYLVTYFVTRSKWPSSSGLTLQTAPITLAAKEATMSGSTQSTAVTVASTLLFADAYRLYNRADRTTWVRYCTLQRFCMLLRCIPCTLHKTWARQAQGNTAGPLGLLTAATSRRTTAAEYVGTRIATNAMPMECYNTVCMCCTLHKHVKRGNLLCILLQL